MIFTKMLLPLLIKLSGKRIICPFYHSISDIHLPHIHHLYQIRTIDQFKNDLDFYSRNFTPLALEQLIDIFLNNKRIEKPCFFLSFDDGLKEIYDPVFPILKERRIPATLFLNSAFIDNHDLFYRYKASLLIDHYNASFQKPLSEYFNREMNQEIFRHELLNIRYQEKNILDEIAEIMSVHFSQFLQEQKPYLKSEQIFELMNNNFTIGAHSVDHPDFHSISSKEQIFQVITSINHIVKKFKIDQKTFAFPFTDHKIQKELYQILKQLDVQLTFGTSGLKDDSIPGNIQRIPIENYPSDGKKTIIREYIHYILKRLLRKNMVLHN